jgi:ATP-dependent Clp protease adapter protein ClpS
MNKNNRKQMSSAFQVIRALELAIACSSANAMRLATIVDREGRSIVRTGSRESCENVKQAIEVRQ